MIFLLVKRKEKENVHIQSELS